MQFRYLAAAALALGLPSAVAVAAGADSSSSPPGPACPMPAHWGVWTPDTKLPDPDAVNVLRLGLGGTLFWNKQPINDAALDALTVQLMKHPVDNLTMVLDPGTADCKSVTKYRKKLEKTGCRKGNCLIGAGPQQPDWFVLPPPSTPPVTD